MPQDLSGSPVRNRSAQAALLYSQAALHSTPEHLRESQLILAEGKHEAASKGVRSI
jgi:hypothetical protein